MDLFHHDVYNISNHCGENVLPVLRDLHNYQIAHHHPIVKCHECGREFIHEKDTSHFVTEEHEQKF